MGKEDMLKNKTAVITGASRGIGKAIALAFAKEGMNVLLAARTADELEATAKACRKYGERHGAQALAVIADVSKEAEVAKLKKAADAAGQAIDIVVNNVGVGKFGNLMSMSSADYDLMMNSNMRSSFLVTRAFAPQMIARKSGHFVFIGSVAGLKPLPGEAVYCASKHAQTAFAHSMDYELRKHNVKVSVIAPGGVDTHFAFGKGRKPGMPILKNMLQAQDVADAVLFTLKQSEKSRVFLLAMRPMAEPL